MTALTAAVIICAYTEQPVSYTHLDVYKRQLLDYTDSAIVARMDADDICLPWRFTRQLAAVHRAPVVFSALVPFGGGRIPVPGAPYRLDGFGLSLIHIWIWK